MKRLLLTLLALMTAAMTGWAETWPAKGTGDSDNPYLIENQADLEAFRDLVNLGDYGGGNSYNGKFIKLTADIELVLPTDPGEKGWNPIGYKQGSSTTRNPFDGTFDGMGHSITGLWIDREANDYSALFGYTGTNAVIRDLVVTIDTGKGGVKGNADAGGLVGTNNGTITGCVVAPVAGTTAPMVTTIWKSGDFGGRFAGGLVGRNYGTITHCYASGKVTGMDQFGGLVGRNDGTIQNCYATGMTAKTSQSGGLVGVNNDTGIITASFSNITLTGVPVIGWDRGTTAAVAFGASTAEMQTIGLYTDADVLGTEVWNFHGTDTDAAVWAIDASATAPFNDGYPYLRWQTPTVTFTLTDDDNFTYTVEDETVTADKPMFAIAAGSDFSFAVVPNTGYTADDAEVTATGNAGGSSTLTLPDGDNSYTLATVACDSTITVTGVSLLNKIVLTPGDHFTYSVAGDIEPEDDGCTYLVKDGNDLTFTLDAEDGYTAADATVTVSGSNGSSFTLTADGNGLYTLAAISCDSTITVTGITVADPAPVITYHTLTLTVGEGLMTDKGEKTSFEIESGNPFSFVITLADGYAGQTPTVTVNGKVKDLIVVGTDKWRCTLSDIFEDTDVRIGFNLTANEQPDAARIYSRSGQLMIETPITTTLSVYTVAGQTLISRRLPEGLTSLPLAKGLYIVRLGQQTEKIMIND